MGPDPVGENSLPGCPRGPFCGQVGTAAEPFVVKVRPSSLGIEIPQRIFPPFLIKVSCLCLEENVDNDPCKFALTSRAGDAMETFVLHSTSPGVRQMWIHEINQILENQRNFLNGKLNCV